MNLALAFSLDSVCILKQDTNAYTKCSYLKKANAFQREKSQLDAIII